MPRTILLLGASNEIIRNGYISYMADSRIVNASVGGSGTSSAILEMARERSRNTAANFAILSHELNENGIISAGLRTAQESADNLEWLIHELRCRSIEPIVLNLPRTNGERFIVTPTRDLQRSVAKRLSVPYIDFHDLFCRLHESGIAIVRLMRDRVHIAEEYYDCVGSYIEDCLDYLELQGTENTRVDEPKYCFSVTWADDLVPRDHVVERSTSLLSSRLAQLKVGQSVRISKEEGLEVVALSINRLAAGANLHLGETRKKLVYGHEQTNSSGFMLVVVDVRPVSVGGMNGLQLSVKGGSEVPTEATFLAGSQSELVGDSGVIEIEGLLLRTLRKERRSVVSRVPKLKNVNLNEVVTASGIRSGRTRSSATGAEFSVDSKAEVIVKAVEDVPRSLVVLGFPKCGTSALVRAIADLPDLELITSRSGALEVGWPEIADIERELPPSNSIRIHKRAAYIYTRTALKYLAETPRTFVLCIRDPMSALVSWHNMHRAIARSGKHPDHFAWREREFYADCTVDDYYRHFAQTRLRYDHYLNDLLSIVPTERVAVVSQERMARGIDSVARYLKGLARGDAVVLEDAAADDARSHVGYADKQSVTIDGAIREELAGVYRRLNETIEAHIRHRCL